MNGVYFSCLYIKADKYNSGLNTYVLYNIYNAKHNSQRVDLFPFLAFSIILWICWKKKSFLDFEILRGIHQAIVKMMINWYKTIFNSYIKGVEYDICP